MWKRCLSLAVLVSLGAGCSQKERSSQAGGKSQEARKPARGRPEARPKALPRPAALPEPGPDGVAKDFPPIVQVPPPEDLAARLATIEQDLTAKDFRKRNEARKALREIVRSHQQDMGLARYLVTRKGFDLVSAGIGILRRLRRQPDYLSVAISLLGHPSDRVRATAVSLVAYGLRAEQFKKALPFLLKLWQDPSCVVRRMALSALVVNRRWMEKPPVSQLLTKALEDECPAVRAYAYRNANLVVGKGKPDSQLVAKLKKAALESPYYLERCAAMLGLGQLKVEGAEKVLAKGLDMPVVPSLTVYYVSERVPYTFTNHGSMPACAADALSALTGKHMSGKPVDKVAAWKKELAPKGLTKRAPKRLCLGRHDCKDKEEVCLNMQCVPLAKAASAYWKLEELRRCKRPDTSSKWRNFVDETLLKVGLGLHWNAPWRIRDHLRKTDLKAFQARKKQIDAIACPREPARPGPRK